MSEFGDLQVAPRREFGARLEALLLEDLGLDGGAEKADEETTTDDRDMAAPTELAVIDGARSRPRRRSAGLLAVAAAMVVLSAGLAITIARRDAPRERTGTGTAAETTAPRTTIAGTTIAPTSTSASIVTELPQLARGDLAPGAYQADHFAVPFTFSTERNWIVDKSRSTLINLITLTGPWLTVTTDIVKGGTADDVAASVCPGAVEFEAAQPTTLLGQPAIQMLGAMKDNCVLQFASDSAAVVDKGVVLQVTVAVVDGTVVTVMAAALSTVWPGSEADIAHILESMSPIP